MFSYKFNSLIYGEHKRKRHKIKYYDITSLYPYVQKTKKYPIGAPKIITENFQSINKSPSDDVTNNKLHKKGNKIDYFTAEKSVKSKPGLGADKSLFKSTSVIDPYDKGTSFTSL